MNTNAISTQLEIVIQMLQAIIKQLPCEHLEVEVIEGATMGNVKYRCKQCGEVVEGDG